MENQEAKRPVPVNEAFIWKDATAFANKFTRQIMDGETPTEVVEDAWAGEEQL